MPDNGETTSHGTVGDAILNVIEAVSLTSEEVAEKVETLETVEVQLWPTVHKRLMVGDPIVNATVACK